MDLKDLINSSNIFINEIIKKKYLLNNEQSYEDMINSRFIPYLKNNNIDAEDILLDRRFIPGGSILRGFQNPAKVSMSNCYVLMPEEDSIEGIFNLCKKMARTYSYSGGVGYDISILRPKNCEVNNSAKYSTGAISFLPLFDTVTRTIGQNGRRGAALAAIQDWHPDLLDFIKAKAYPGDVFNKDSITGELPTISYTNISVKLSDEFMEAVEADGDWKLYFPDTTCDEYKFWDGDIEAWIRKGNPIVVYKTIKARDILRLIAECSHKCGDPGILFWDLHKKYSTVEFSEKTRIDNVNPCVTGDTMLFTKYGLELIQELVDQEVEIWNGFEWITVTPRITGYNKEILEITFDNGIKLKCTKNHKFVLKDGITRVEAINLTPGDELLEWRGVNGSIIRGVRVKRIRYAGVVDKVYCFTEPKRHLGMFNGIVTGQCGEMPLHTNANCNLGTIVLYKYVNNPYIDKAEFNFELFKNDCKLAVEIMDCLLDESINKHPLIEQRKQAAYERRIGIGITGLADCLAMMGLKYDNSPETINFIEQVMKTKCKIEWETSLELAINKGCAPALKDPKSREKFLEQPKIKEYLEFLDDSFEYKFMQHGVRNIAISTVQPSGTLSIIANNCTSGIEPLFAMKYKRKTRVSGQEEVEIIHPPLLEYLYKNNLVDDLQLSSEELCKKYNYIDAHNVKYEDRLYIQSIIQRYVDTAISSTVNLPVDTTIDDIYNLYLKSYQNKLKGITIFRDLSKEGVLQSNSKSESTKTSYKYCLTPEVYNRIINYCNQNNLNDLTKLALIEEYLRIGETSNSVNDLFNKDYINNSLKENKNNNINNLYELELQDLEDSETHIVRWKNNIKVYMSVIVESDDEKKNPLSIYLSLPYEAGLDVNQEFNQILYLERKSDWDCIARLISTCLRYNIPLAEIIEQLHKTSYGMFVVPALFKRVLSKYLQFEVNSEDSEELSETDEELQDWENTIGDGLDILDINNTNSKAYTIEESRDILRLSKSKFTKSCPDCGKDLIFEAGCWKCLNCFYSKCE